MSIGLLTAGLSRFVFISFSDKDIEVEVTADREVQGVSEKLPEMRG